MHLAGVMRASRSDFDDPQTYEIIGAGMAVHRELGCGFLEAVNREAFTIELEQRGIPFVREARLPVRYRSRLLTVYYQVDFICFGEILVELKALHAIGPVEQAQLINYLRAAHRSRGLLLNFGFRVFSTSESCLVCPMIPPNRL